MKKDELMSNHSLDMPICCRMTFSDSIQISSTEMTCVSKKRVRVPQIQGRDSLRTENAFVGAPTEPSCHLSVHGELMHFTGRPLVSTKYVHLANGEQTWYSGEPKSPLRS
jgi:hypothetical protein